MHQQSVTLWCTLCIYVYCFILLINVYNHGITAWLPIICTWQSRSFLMSPIHKNLLPMQYYSHIEFVFLTIPFRRKYEFPRHQSFPFSLWLRIIINLLQHLLHIQWTGFVHLLVTAEQENSARIKFSDFCQNAIFILFLASFAIRSLDQ